MSYEPVQHINQRISIRHLWAFVILAGVFIFVNTHPIRPHDFWWHIAVGREILLDGQIPKVDTYSYTMAGENYPSYQGFWLMEILLYMIYRLGGPALVVFFQSLVITSAYLLVFITCFKQVENWRLAALGTAFASAMGMNDWNVRPQAITILLGSMVLFLIQQLRSGTKRGWALLFPILMVVWVNSHGSYPLGLFFLCLWFGQDVWDLVRGKQTRPQDIRVNRILYPGLVLLTSTLACLVNPSGVGTIKYQLSLWGNTTVQNLVVEWAAPTFNMLGGSLFLGSLLLVAFIFAFSPRRVTFFQVFAYLGFAFLALRTSRGILWFGLVMAPVVVEHIKAIWLHLTTKSGLKGDNSGNPVVNWIFIGVILLLVVVTLPWFKEYLPLPETKAGLISSETPVRATEYLLETRPEGNIFHAMSFGSYMIWAAQPNYQVFVDSRIELFPANVWHDYLQISAAMGDWEGKLARYGAHTLMLSSYEQPELVNAVLNSSNWELVFEDDAALVFVSR